MDSGKDQVDLFMSYACFFFFKSWGLFMFINLFLT